MHSWHTGVLSSEPFIHLQKVNYLQLASSSSWTLILKYATWSSWFDRLFLLYLVWVDYSLFSVAISRLEASIKIAFSEPKKKKTKRVFNLIISKCQWMYLSKPGAHHRQKGKHKSPLHHRSSHFATIPKNVPFFRALPSSADVQEKRALLQAPLSPTLQEKKSWKPRFKLRPVLPSSPWIRSRQESNKHQEEEFYAQKNNKKSINSDLVFFEFFVRQSEEVKETRTMFSWRNASATVSRSKQIETLTLPGG